MGCLLRQLLNDEVGTSACVGLAALNCSMPIVGSTQAEMLALSGDGGIMCGGVYALRFHPCNLLSIVGDYFELFNYSDDIYQGQLYQTTSCRENGVFHCSLAGECFVQEPLAGSSQGVPTSQRPKCSIMIPVFLIFLQQLVVADHAVAIAFV